MPNTQCEEQTLHNMDVQCREARVLGAASSQNRLKQVRYIKESVCRNNPSNPDELETSMSNIIASISLAMLQTAYTDMLRPVRLHTQHVNANFQKVF
jgi:hypothetical protein